jgi:hypothetical protein
MDAITFRSFVKTAMRLQSEALGLPSDYVAVRAVVADRFPALEKQAFDWHSAKEGLIDEGIPLTGASIGAHIAKPGKGLRGAALGYALGGGASIARSYLKGEKPSKTRRILAAGALGYGAGGGLHAIGETLTKAHPASAAGKMFHGNTRLVQGMEETIPAIGATLGTGIGAGLGSKKNKQPGPPNGNR